MTRAEALEKNARLKELYRRIPEKFYIEIYPRREPKIMHLGADVTKQVLTVVIEALKESRNGYLTGQDEDGKYHQVILWDAAVAMEHPDEEVRER